MDAKLAVPAVDLRARKTCPSPRKMPLRLLERVNSIAQVR
jgi:hypothetical protein